MDSLSLHSSVHSKVSICNKQPQSPLHFYKWSPTKRVNLSSTPSYRRFCIAAQSQQLQQSPTHYQTQKQFVKNLLPVIDFTRKDLKPGSSCWVSTGKEVLEALEKYGCFEAVCGEAIPLELQNSMNTALDQLFELSVEAKKRYKTDIPYFGYLPSETTRIQLYDGIGFMEAANLEGTQKFTNTLWPEGNEFFCKTVLAYSEKVARLEQKVMEMVFERYGVDEYEAHKESTVYMFRMAKYRLPTSKDDTNIGIGTHTDKTFISILGQHQIGGLAVRTKDRQWTTIEPSTSSVVVMAGEALTGWSNGRIHAPFHKVIMEGNKERYSLGTFSFHRGIVDVPKVLIDEEHPLKFKPFDNLEFMRYFYNGLGRNKYFTLKGFCGI